MGSNWLLFSWQWSSATTWANLHVPVDRLISCTRILLLLYIYTVTEYKYYCVISTLLSHHSNRFQQSPHYHSDDHGAMLLLALVLLALISVTIATFVAIHDLLLLPSYPSIA